MASILVVDHEAIVREPIGAALAAHGHEVLLAGSGYEALGILNECEVDLVILELMLPQIHGITILSRIRDDRRLADLPVVLLTRCVDREVLAQPVSLGVKHIVLKPQFSMDLFLARVQSALSRGAAAARADRGGGADAHRGMAVTHAAVGEDQPEPAAAPEAAAVEQPADGGARAAEPMRKAARTGADSLAQLKTLTPLLDRATSMKRLESCPDLGALSPAVVKLLKLTGGDSATVQQVSKALRQDHSLALKILKLANSSMYSRGEPVESLDKAVLQIGMGQIRQVLLSIAIIDSFSSHEFGGAVDLGLFWEHSIGSGIVAAGLAESRSEEEAERAFTMGLVHNVGRLMLARAMPEAFAEAISVADDLGLALHEVEKHLLGVDHAGCMEHLLHRWRFPKEFNGPIVWHHASLDEARKQISSRLPEFAMLSLAQRLCVALLIGDDGEEMLSSTESLCTELKLPADQLRKIAETAIDETADVKLALLAQIADSTWTDSRTLVRQRLQTPVRAAYCSLRPEFDAFAFFFNQLDDEETQENLAVVHITSPTEIGALTFQLAEQEKQLGQRLPLLVIRPDDSIDCPPAMLDGRPSAIVHEPVGIRELADTVHDLVAGATEVANAA